MAPHRHHEEEAAAAEEEETDLMKIDPISTTTERPRAVTN